MCGGEGDDGSEITSRSYICDKVKNSQLEGKGKEEGEGEGEGERRGRGTNS